MEIILLKDELFNHLFPEAANTSQGKNQELLTILRNGYQVGAYIPDITIKGNTITIQIDVYCLSALRFIKDKTPAQIKELGFEIAMMGRQGFNTDSPEKNYHFAGVPGKVFSGLEALAWMFTTWKQIDSSVDIGADFRKEFQLAETLMSK